MAALPGTRFLAHRLAIDPLATIFS